MYLTPSQGLREPHRDFRYQVTQCMIRSRSCNNFHDQFDSALPVMKDRQHNGSTTQGVIIMGTAIRATRKGGKVAHVISGIDVASPCGRFMVYAPSGEGMRMCKTCVRINADARRMDDHDRKAAREIRMRTEMEGKELSEEFISWEFDLNSEELAATLAKIEKLNTRCANRGVPGGLNVEWREETRKETNTFGITTEFVVYPTKITGISPQIPGWEFVATLDYDHNAGLIVRTYPGVQSIDRSALREGWCDHCQTNRYRTTSYVVRNVDTGEEIQVGSSCIKDFTGWTALPVSFDRMAKDVEEMSGGFGGGPRDFTTLSVLAVAWACVTEYGYVRSRESGATVGLVGDVLDPPKKISPEYRAELERLSAHSDVMMERATELRAWMLSDEFSGNSEYVLNLKAIAGADKVSPRNLGILCSAPQAWARYMEKTFIAEKVQAPESNWVGEIGERWELSLTFKTVRYIESMYGSTALHTFTDNAGNVFKWFASNADFGGHEGEVFHVTGGIKAHKDWKGAKETHLTRVKEIDAEMVESKKIKDAPIKAKDEMRIESLTIDPSKVYVMNGSYYKIRTTKGIAYAVKHTENGWEYAHRSVTVLKATDEISAEDAARFGKTHAHCVFCVRPLTDERSLSVGYGPECASRMALPWGE